MIRHKIGTYAGGVAGMIPAVDLLSIHQDPTSTFIEYASIVGKDLNGRNIEAGFPRATWTWPVMPQADFDALLAYANTQVIIRTRTNAGAGGYDFDNFSAYADRPTADIEQTHPLVRHNVSISFNTLIAI